MRNPRASCFLALLLLVACGKEPPREDSSAAPAEASRPATPPPPPAAPPPAAPAPAAAPAAPEPTTPAEIELAMKAAMVEGRDLDVIKYCEMADGAAVKGNPQSVLGCTLAACRADQSDKAQAWGKTLPKALKKQAIQVCMANEVAL